LKEWIKRTAGNPLEIYKLQRNLKK
jgi:hypothetical protein